MKERNGLVSNSSSSSFILYKKMKKDEFIMDIKIIWKQLHWKHSEEVSKENLDEISFFIAPKEMNKKEAKIAITEAYNNECWGASERTIPFSWKNDFWYKIKKLFSKTYLDEALKADVFGTTQDNAVPYLVLEELRNKYGKKLIIHHLG